MLERLDNQEWSKTNVKSQLFQKLLQLDHPHEVSVCMCVLRCNSGQKLTDGGQVAWFLDRLMHRVDQNSFKLLSLMLPWNNSNSVGSHPHFHFCNAPHHIAFIICPEEGAAVKPNANQAKVSLRFLFCFTNSQKRETKAKSGHRWWNGIIPQSHPSLKFFSPNRPKFHFHQK